MKTLLLILLLSLSAFAQKPTYDKFQDRTTLEVSLSGSGLQANWRAVSKGKTLTSPEFQLFLIGGHCFGYCFNDSTLRLLIDGERLAFPSDQIGDVIAFTNIDRATIERLASAKLVEFQIAQYQGRWKAKDLARLKALL